MQQSADGGHHLCGLLFLVAIGSAEHAVGGMLIEEAKGDFVQSGLDGRDLGEDVDAVAILVDHLLDAADLTLDALEARLELILRCRVSAHRRFSSSCCHALNVALPLPPRGNATLPVNVH